MDEWKRSSVSKRVWLHRTGWPGFWDWIVARVTRRPQKTVETDLTMSVYHKGGNVDLRIWDATCEASRPDQ